MILKSRDIKLFNPRSWQYKFYEKSTEQRNTFKSIPFIIVRLPLINCWLSVFFSLSRIESWIQFPAECDDQKVDKNMKT